jgi:hypothetical protein
VDGIKSNLAQEGSHGTWSALIQKEFHGRHTAAANSITLSSRWAAA